MPRPPPLHLDNMFPVQPRMGIKGLMNRVYRSNWRMLVISIASLNAIRFFLSASEALDDLKVDNAQKNLRLASVSQTLATLYIISCGIELYGAFSAFRQTQTFIRAYAYLVFLSATLVTGAGVVSTAAYFTLADELVRECAALTTAGELGSKSLFRADPWLAPTLSSDDALTHCLDAWSAESFSEVVSTAVIYLLPSAVHCLVVYVYFCQTGDAAHPANLTASGSAIRMAARSRGSAPYNPLRSGAGPQNTRPTQATRRTTVSPRSYQTAVAVASVASLSPGPPSFNVARIGDPGGYQAFRLSAGSEDDTFI